MAYGDVVPLFLLAPLRRLRRTAFWGGYDGHATEAVCAAITALTNEAETRP